MFLNRVPGGNFLVRTFLKNNMIFTEGSKGDTAYILTEGKVEISGRVGGRKKVFAHLKPVSIFGEMALFLEDQSRTASAMALEDCKVVVLNRYDIEDAISQSPQVIATIVEVLVARLKTTTKQALKVPNVFIGLCRMFEVMADNGMRQVRYESLVRHMAETFLVEPGVIEQHLERLAKDGLVTIRVTETSARFVTLNRTDFLAAVTAG